MLITHDFVIIHDVIYDCRINCSCNIDNDNGVKIKFGKITFNIIATYKQFSLLNNE